MKSKLFRRPTANGQRKTALSRGAHLSPEGHLSSRAAALSALLPLLGRGLGGGLLLLIAAPALAQTPNLTVCGEYRGFSLISAENAESPEGLGEVTYDWYENNEAMGSHTASICISEGRPTGTYAYVRKASNDVCEKVASNIYIVKVSKQPSVTISPISARTTPGATVTLTAIASQCDDCTYHWSTDETSSSITVIASEQTVSQYYSCTVTAGESCTATSAATVSVGPPGDTPVTFCPSCCWDGAASTWVNCFVTTNAYPFENTTTTTVPWSGAGTVFFADASSDRNGRDNTADIASTGTSAVQLCKDLGMGWYLPAYEELVNMSRGVSYSPLNGLSGAGVLTGSYHWSSTEYYENGGRYTSAVTSFQQRAVQVYPDGDMSNALKTNNYSIRCAWIDAFCDEISAPTAPSSNARCGAGTVTFSATPPAGHTISWFATPTGNTPVSGAQGVTSFAPHIDAAATYYAVAVDPATGCMSESRTAVSGTVLTVPGVTISPLTARTTPGVDVRLTATATQCDGCTYLWSTGEATNSIMVTAPAADVVYYSCTVTSGEGCTATTAAATVTVGPPGDTPVTFCPSCCWDGAASTWVNCFVTTNAYPFENTTTTTVPWSGAGTVFFAGASSDRNGRDNTADIASTGTSAVQLCKDLGMGWYLPAYEELVNMSRGVSYSPLNGLSGAGVLTGSYHWSSTEYYENGGRYTSAVTSFQQRAVQVYPDGDMSNALKTNNYSIRCAWWF